MRKKLIFIFLLLLVAFPLSAQDFRGYVTSQTGEPLAGVSVLVKGTADGAVTDGEGRFTIAAKTGDILLFSFLGMMPEEVAVPAGGLIHVTMREDIAALDATVVVAYGAQKRSSLTGAISTVSATDVLKAPATGISNIVGARVSGISAVQSSGQPGSDNASLTIRGQGNVIFVIDGIRRTEADFNGLDPNEIESISVLKDASAVAVYGLDANGAFVVTTRRGREEDVSIEYAGTVGISQNAERQEWLDGPSYAYWYNKARVLQGDTEVFTEEMVQKMRDGVDGWGNTDWYGKIYGTGVRQHHNLSASGGSQKVHFFASIGLLDEKGNIKNYNYTRYNLRSNVDASLAKGLSLNLGISSRVEDRDAPYFTANPNSFMNVPMQTCYALPYMPETVETEDGRVLYTANPTNGSPVTPVASTRESGYSRSTLTYTQADFSLRYEAPWLEGLAFKFQGAYDVSSSRYKTLRTPMEVMLLTLPNADTEVLGYTKTYYSVIGNTPVLSETAGNTSQITSQTSVTYDHLFGRHSVGLLALAETRERRTHSMGATGYGLDFVQLDELSNITNLTGSSENKTPDISGSSGHSRVAGFVGRLNYNYAERYYLETSVRYDGSYLFGGMNKRWVLLPSLSMAWRISNEEWFKVDPVDHLKFRLSIGKTASSGVSAFQWMNTMNLNQNAVVIGGASQTAITASVLGNPNLTWAQCLNYNAGLDATLWHGLLGVELDVFYKYEYDKLSSVTGAWPPSMGGYYFSSANVNKVDYKGFDLTLTHRNRVGSVDYGIKAIWSWAYGRWLRYAGDSENAPDYQRLTGKQIGARRGLVDMGLFQTEEEISNAATDASRPAYPGYIRYKDLNGDGVITLNQDMAYVGKSTIPTHTGSVNLTASWHGFDADVLFSWGLGNEIAIQGIYSGVDGVTNGTHGATAFSRPFYQFGNAPVYLVTNCWTPEHRDAEFPRLEISPRSLNNGYASTFWYRSGNYLRFKTAQVGYTFPRKWTSKAGIEKLRIYVEGFNLWTLSALSKYNIDPEAPSVSNGYYPQQQTAAMGVKLTF